MIGNFNIEIDIDCIPGARVMEIQGNREKRNCVVIPIDSNRGTVADSYMGKSHDGLPEVKFFKHVKMRLVAIEHRNKRYGISHSLKPSFSKEHEERMTEEQLYAVAWCGTLKPWAGTKDDDDLAADNAVSDTNAW